jgi:hypothetical protein
MPTFTVSGMARPVDRVRVHPRGRRSARALGRRALGRCRIGVRLSALVEIGECFFEGDGAGAARPDEPHGNGDDGHDQDGGTDRHLAVHRQARWLDTGTTSPVM